MVQRFKEAETTNTSNPTNTTNTTKATDTTNMAPEGETSNEWTPVTLRRKKKEKSRRKAPAPNESTPTAPKTMTKNPPHSSPVTQRTLTSSAATPNTNNNT